VALVYTKTVVPKIVYIMSTFLSIFE